MPLIHPKDLVGRTFLPDKEGSQRLRNRIVKALDIFEGDLVRGSYRLKFLHHERTIEEIFTYNELLNHVNNSQEDYLIECKFKDTLSHEGLLTRIHPNYDGSPQNFTIE